LRYARSSAPGLRTSSVAVMATAVAATPAAPRRPAEIDVAGAGQRTDSSTAQAAEHGTGERIAVGDGRDAGAAGSTEGAAAQRPVATAVAATRQGQRHRECRRNQAKLPHWGYSVVRSTPRQRPSAAIRPQSIGITRMSQTRLPVTTP